MFHPTILFELTKERQAELARMMQKANQHKALKQVRRLADKKQ